MSALFPFFLSLFCPNLPIGSKYGKEKLSNSSPKTFRTSVDHKLLSIGLLVSSSDSNQQPAFHSWNIHLVCLLNHTWFFSTWSTFSTLGGPSDLMFSPARQFWGQWLPLLCLPSPHPHLQYVIIIVLPRKDVVRIIWTYNCHCQLFLTKKKSAISDRST